MHFASYVLEPLYADAFALIDASHRQERRRFDFESKFTTVDMNGRGLIARLHRVPGHRNAWGYPITFSDEVLNDIARTRENITDLCERLVAQLNNIPPNVNISFDPHTCADLVATVAYDHLTHRRWLRHLQILRGYITTTIPLSARYIIKRSAVVLQLLEAVKYLAFTCKFHYENLKICLDACKNMLARTRNLERRADERGWQHRALIG